VIGIISVLSATEHTNQLSILHNVLIVVSKLYDRATAGGRTSIYGRTSRTVCHVRNTVTVSAPEHLTVEIDKTRLSSS
jgi:hypothetical protein